MRTIDGVLSWRSLRACADDGTWDRAQGYLRRVRGLRITSRAASATVQGDVPYAVQLCWPGSGIEGECTCPYAAEGHFCKHLVAVGLRVLEDAGAGEAGPSRSPVAAYLESLSADELRALVTDLATHSESATRSLERLAAVHVGDDAAVRDGLTAALRRALSVRGFVDYWRTFEVARDVDEVLGELSDLIDAGGADLAAPILLSATKRLRTIQQRADDSGGVLGDAESRAVELYARACREGNPSQARLGSWLAKYRDESPGWPEVSLELFAEALGDKGIAAYRAAVDAIDRRLAGAEARCRSEIDCMLLELADHDGDLDRAIALLDAGGRWAEIIERLLAAERRREAMEWLQRAGEAGRITVTAVRNGAATNPFWVDARRAIALLREDGRDEAALALARGQFEEHAGPAAYELLLTTAEALGVRARERARALAWVDAQDWRSGDTPVTLALHEGDVERAWAAADRWGLRFGWRALADASPQPRPTAALDLHTAHLREALRHTGRGPAAEAVGILRHMRTLAEAFDAAAAEGSGPQPEAPLSFVEAVNALALGLRTEFARRPTLLDALAEAGW